MASLEQTKLERLPWDVQNDPHLELLSLSQEMKDEIYRLITVPPPTLPIVLSSKKISPIHNHAHNLPKTIMRMRAAEDTNIRCHTTLRKFGEPITLTCSSLLQDGNAWFDPGTRHRQHISKFLNIRLNIIFGPMHVPNHGVSFSPAVKLEEIVSLFRSPGSNVRHIYVQFMQSESLVDAELEHDVSKFSTLTQMLVLGALIATREMIRIKRLNLAIKSNGEVLVEEEGRIVSQQEAFEGCTDPPPYSRY